MERCVNIWTNPGEVILDFTMGSGSTGRAALNCHRKFIGIERDKGWFNVAKERLEDTTLYNQSNQDEELLDNFNF